MGRAFHAQGQSDEQPGAHRIKKLRKIPMDRNRHSPFMSGTFVVQLPNKRRSESRRSFGRRVPERRVVG
eukprot:315613-Pyramimonas_sp.AAC.1